MLATVALLAGDTFKAEDAKFVGDLKYGQTGEPVECPGTPAYCAFVFNGQGGDRAEVNVSNGTGKAFVAIANGALAEIATGANRVVFSLPSRGPDTETYYIVFRDSESKSQRFVVELKKFAK